MICGGGFSFTTPVVYVCNMNAPLAEKIKTIRTSMGLDQAPFGELLGASQSTVARWERGALPKAAILQRIAELANTSVESLLGMDEALPDSIPVVGYVGAGAAVIPCDDYAHGDGMYFIERPPFVTGKAVAVEIKGDSMLPIAEDGWRIVYGGEQRFDEAEVLNKLCVVQLEDGRALVKRIMRGSQPHRYHLVSSNAPMIEDAQINWAARVKAIIPA